VNRIEHLNGHMISTSGLEPDGTLLFEFYAYLFSITGGTPNLW